MDPNLLREIKYVAISMTPIQTGLLQSTVDVISRPHGCDIHWGGGPVDYASEVNANSPYSAGYAERAQQYIQMLVDGIYDDTKNHALTNGDPDFDMVDSTQGPFARYENDVKKMNNRSGGGV